MKATACRIGSCLAALWWSVAAMGQGPIDASDLEGNYPVVITPTRLLQSMADVPASVSIITTETMRRYGIHSVVDALRLVPGMEVAQVTGSDARLNYHGTNVLVPRRMNVLIDGVSAYRPGFAQVDWATLPVAMEDIERIEVARGPDSASYGPNSMLAVVNIVTKHPRDVEHGLASLTVGSLGTTAVTGRAGIELGSTKLRVTLQRQRDSGYDQLSRTAVAGGHDSTEVKRLSVRSETSMGASSSLGLQAWVVDASKDVPFVDAYQVRFPDARVNDYYLDAIWKVLASPLHEVQVRVNYANSQTKQPWVTCIPTAAALPQLVDLWRLNPSYVNQILGGHVPSGGTALDNALAASALAEMAAVGAQARAPLCVQPNQNLDQSRTDFEFQDTAVLSDHLRLVSGIGARTERAVSQTYLAGSVRNVLYRAFAHAEYKPVHWLSVNAGGYWEDDRLSGATFAPRLAVNAHLSEKQSVRFVVSKGTRAPDIYEQRVNWSYDFTAPRPVAGQTNLRFYQSALSPGDLRAERIASKEIGYLLRVHRLGLLLDVKAFDDELSSLLSEKLQVADFHPTNNNSVHLSGVELQSSAELSTSWSAFLNFAYLDNRQATLLTERTQYSRQSGSVGVSFAPGGGWRMSMAYLAASGDGLGQSRYGRKDLTLMRAFNMSGHPSSVSLTVSALDSPQTTTFRDFRGADPVLVSRYDSRVHVVGQVIIGF